MGREYGAIDVGNFGDAEDGDGFVVAIEKTGNNGRRIRLEVVVCASLQEVWEVLTDYERLAYFVPSLAVSRLVEKKENFAHVFQAYPKEYMHILVSRNWHLGFNSMQKLP